MKYVCIHGHFYQPPRENPYLEAIELQDSAYPYHDWNERITAECYAPNAASRILDSENRIVKLLNNYSQISFNFGPTLLSWMKEQAAPVYQAIIEADQQSVQKFSGHGSAIAQGYNHMILPLANRRDKVTQVKWGIRDFESRFGRKPEGMWLPETAVDTETLEVLAENGIQFTILAPRQAQRIRSKNSSKFEDVTGGRIDPARAYLAELPSKKRINLFFYDGPISQGVAFEGLLNDGKRFADRLMSGFSDSRQGPQLVHIATDGESYGHHHHHGEMALSYALDQIQRENIAKLTNYGEFLEKHPPKHFVEIVNNSSWSCVHGIERWRSDCGCNSGGHPWNQQWRAPLRAALDWLRDKLAAVFESRLKEFVRDPWATRDDYIRVILDRSEETRKAFFADHAIRPLDPHEQVTALKLLEMQRHAMLMYTSCGWFFDELSGLETVQVIHYAGRALQLAEECCAEKLEPEFLQHLALAKSNLPEHGDGAKIYENWVKPALVDIERVGGHYAISSLFESYPEKTHIYCYEVERLRYSVEAEGKIRLATGRAQFRSSITEETADLDFTVLHLGDHNVTAGIRPADAATDEDQQKLVAAFGQADTAEVIRLLDQVYGNETFSLRQLFRDEQRKITSLILNESLSSAAAVYRTVFEGQAPLIRFLNGLDIPVPNALKSAAQIALNSQLEQYLDRPELDSDSIQGLLREAAASKIVLDSTTLEYKVRKRLEKEAADFAANPSDPAVVERIIKLLDLIPALPFPVTLWEAQNVCYRPLVTAFQQNGWHSPAADPAALRRHDDLNRLASQLHILLPEAEAKMPPKRLPSATYRVQLNQDFRFADATRILDYLHELGISDLYLSPVLASRKGSGHGYDITDPTRINPDLGSEEEFTTLQNELQKRGMGLLLDTVPNHMAASAENPWWMDVLENGTQSAFAAFFDIDWHPHSRSLDGRILLPVLGRPFGEALDSGEIKLIFQESRFFFQYFESLFPLAPRSYHAILNHRRDRLKEILGEDAPAFHEYSGIIASFGELSRADRRSAETAADRRLRFESSRDRLRSLIVGSREVSSFVEENVTDINGKQGDPGSLGFLQRLLAEQNYTLAFWQNLNESINYRRFFTITELVGIRVEDPVVFEATHGYILRLVSKNPYAGLRVDHIDGLRDPLAYLNRLQERLSSDEARKEASSYVLVEKILARRESLPEDWPVDGTTGYDYLNEANSLFVDPLGARPIEEIYSDFIGRRQNFADVVYQKKKLVMNTLLGVEMRTLGRHLAELAAQDRYARELNREQLIDALIEVTACLPVYRTYIRSMELPAHASKYIEEAVTTARTRAPNMNSACFDFVRDVLLILNPPHVLVDQREGRLAFVMRWQQFTGPIVAKGLEDTALYVYHPLLSLNEVGGEPSPSDAPSLDEFYAFLDRRQRSWPGSLSASSTHDTKRSEDVRARLNVLSEIPSEWKQHLDLWAQQNAKHKQQIKGESVPDRNEEYFLYQTLLGVWPLDHQNGSLLKRVQDYIMKATREAMVHTRWTRPSQPHEDALLQFVAKILSSQDNGEFLEDFHRFQKKIAYFGMINGLSQTLLKIAAPGVPDFYQGSELWDLRLVDPDNRGPIDFNQRMAALESIAHVDSSQAVHHFVENWHDGCIKLYLIWKAIRFRRDHTDLFRDGEFIPLQSSGSYSRNVTAFLRRKESSWALAVTPRWLSQVPAKSEGGCNWGDTSITLPADSPKHWNSIVAPTDLLISNEEGEHRLTVENLFREFPVAFCYAEN